MSEMFKGYLQGPLTVGVSGDKAGGPGLPYLPF